MTDQTDRKGVNIDPAKAVKPLPVDGDWDRDEGADWRHEPRPAKDENPLDSFGKAIGDVVTGSDAAVDTPSGEPATHDPAAPRKP